MKTPKRTRIFTAKCPICGWSSPVNIKAGAPDTLIQCNFCDAQWLLQASNNPSNAFYARWKRKNREARLRRALYWQAREIRLLSWANKELGKTRARLSSLLVLAGIQHDCEVGNFNASGTFGQDIEGS